jgi:hypothetical protein
LIHTSPFSVNGGKQVVILSLSSIGNWWPVATHTRIGQCLSSWFSCAPLGRKNPQTPPQLPRPPVSARQAAFLFLHQPEKLDASEQETLVLLRQFHPEVDLAYDLVQQFVQMLRNRTGELLDTWLVQVQSSNLLELLSFAAGIEKDKDAVRAGLNGRDQ